MSEDSQDPSAGAAPAEVSENLAPASDDEVLRSVSGAEFSDPKGAPPPVSHPPAPQPTTPTLPTDAAIEIPQETTRALYVFNARVANRRDGVPTATCDVVVKSREGAETRVTSLAPGEKYLNPTATYGDEYVATCADTKQELARWIVEARRGYDVTRRSITGKEYLQRKWIDPEVQKVVLGEWTSWRRLLTPNALDYDMSHWDEPEDDPETGEVAHPFVQRFLYYLVARHQVLTCFFVGEGDAFSRRERLADLTDTVFWTWVITVAFLDLDSVSRVFIVAMFMTPISAVFQIASRIQCCGVEWGRVITIPLWVAGCVSAIAVAAVNADKPAFNTVAGSFFSSLAFQWVLVRPSAIALRVWLYEKGWNRHVGIGPKTRWFFDRAASGAGLG